MTEPRTTAGRRLTREYYNGGRALSVEDALAIEAEARAAGEKLGYDIGYRVALDEARAAIEHCGLHPESLAGELALAAIDALRKSGDSAKG